MGAWGYGIKENDAAMDMMNDFESIVSYDSNYGRQHPQYHDLPFPEKISYVIDELIAHCRDSEEEGHFRAVGFQALACLIMEQGSAVTPMQWRTISDECVQCPEYQLAQELSHQGKGAISSQAMLEHGFEDDMWGIEAHQKRLEGRLNAINHFIELMNNYPVKGGHVQSIEHMGLIEAMTQAQHKPKF